MQIVTVIIVISFFGSGCYLRTDSTLFLYHIASEVCTIIFFCKFLHVNNISNTTCFIVYRPRISSYKVSLSYLQRFLSWHCETGNVTLPSYCYFTFSKILKDLQIFLKVHATINIDFLLALFLVFLFSSKMFRKLSFLHQVQN